MSRRRLAVVLLGLLCVLPAVALGQTVSVSFVDENGAAVAVYPEGGRAFVRVQNPAANTTPGWDTVTVYLGASRSGDTESLQLTETGAATGVFLGGIPLAPDTGGGQPGVLETGTEPAPPYTRDTIEVSYFAGSTYSDVATMVGSILQFLDAQGRPTSAYGLGERVWLRLTAPLTNDPINQTAQLVVLQGGSDSENVYLNETGLDTGVYEALVQSQWGAGNLNNGNLEVDAQGAPVTATYQDSDVPTTSQASAMVGESRSLFVTAQGTEAEYYLEGTRAYLWVFYDSPFFLPSNVDSISVTVTSVHGGDSEAVYLYETGPDTNVFTGSIQLIMTNSFPYFNNGLLETGVSGPPYQFDTLNVVFPGNYTSSSDSVSILGSLTSFIDAYGNETSSFVGGGRIYVRVEEPASEWGGESGTISATVQSLATQDAETVTLYRTGVGIFEGFVESRVGVAPFLYDGTLEVGIGETIQAMHTDINGLLASGALATIRYAGISFIDGDGRPVTELLEEGLLRIRVHSPSDSAPGGPQTLEVLVTSRHSNDSETVILTETGQGTGIFEGSIRMSTNWPTQGEGTLETGNTGWPQYLGDEVSAFYESASVTARTRPSRLEFLDHFGRVTNRLVVGGLIRLRLTAYGRDNYSYVRESVSLDLAGCFDDEVLTLQETGVNTGVFEGQIASATSDAPGVLTAALGCEVVGRFQNENLSPWTEARATYGSGTIEFVDADGNPASVYLEGTRAWVRLEAPVFDTDPGWANAVYSVQIQSALTNEQAPVYLYETGPSTGVFTGSVLLRRGSPSPYDEVLDIGESQGPPHLFDTLTVRLPVSATEELTDTASTLNYRIWFIDSFGQVVSSYTQGQRVYVRVEDFRNNDPGVYNRTYVQVTSTSGDVAYIEVLETGRNTGIFEGSILLDGQNPPRGDNALQAGPGAGLTAVLDDSYSFHAAPAEATVAIAAIEFIDAEGRPTTTLLEDDYARVRLYSAQDNAGASAIDDVQVEVSSLYFPDSKLVILTETGPDTGVFEGAIRTRLAHPAAPGEEVLDIATSGSPLFLGDELTARYGSYSVKARMTGARVDFVDSFGRVTSKLPLGLPVRVRVTDYRRNDSGIRDNHPIDIVGCGDSEVLALQETGFDTAVYEGTLNSSASSGAAGNGTLNGTLGCVVSARWADSARPDGVSAQATFSGGSMAFTDAQGNLTSVFLEGTRAYLRVESPVSNTDPGYENALYDVQVRSDITGDTAPVYLYETGPNTGVFKGSFVLRRDPYPSPYNETLEVGEDPGPPHRFDTMTARLTLSGTDEVTATATTLNQRLWFIDAFGQVVTSYAQGTRVYVRLEDHRYGAPSEYDRAYVRVTSTSGDLVYAELEETGRNTGIYEGSVPLDSVNPPSGDGTLQAGPGARITAAPDDPASAATPAEATIELAALEFIDEAGRPTAAVLENGVARVRLYSAQSNTGPAADLAPVQLSSLYGGDQEVLTLTETGGATGVFEGSLQLRDAPNTPSNGFLETFNSGAPEYLGDLLTAAFGQSRASARTAGARVVFVDAFGRETTSLNLGSPVRVRVIDHRRNDPVTRDNHPLDLVGCGDAEVVALQETGFNTAVYEGSLNSSSSSGGAGNGTLNASLGCVLEARWSDIDRPEPRTAQAAFGGGSMVFTDAAGNLTGVFLEGTRAYLRVESAASNTDPYSQNALYGVQVRSDVTGDSTYAYLYETGPDTGVFTGSFELRQGLPSPYNETLEVGEELTPSHRFDTMTAQLYLSSTELTATATTLNYRIWFVDAFGQVVDSYPQGSRVYVRMEDHRFGSPSLYDRAYARVAFSSGVTVYAELVETGRNTGIFEGSIAMVGDPGDDITATADDTSFAASPARATIEFSALEFIDGAGLPTATVQEEGAARARLYTAQHSGGPSTVDTVQVQFRSLYGDDVEVATLTETGASTNVFEGAIPTRFAGSRVVGDGELDVTTSGVPEYLGDLLTVSYGPYSATARMAGARVVFVDAFGRETTSLGLGTPVRVRVTDYRRNDPLNRDAETLDLVGCGDAEALEVLETGFNTGVFEGALPSSSSSAVSGNGTLNGALGCVVEARWLDLGRPNRLTAQASFGGGSLAFTDAQGNLTGSFLEGGRAYLRVEAAGANTNPNSQESLYGLQVWSDITGDQVGVYLNETGDDTGIFMGSFELRRGLANPYNETLEVGEELVPVHRFDTMTARLYLSSAELTATASTLPYRIWFIDSFGQVTDSYPQGTRVYVRMEDRRTGSPTAYDRAYARVTSSSGDAAYVELLETGRNTGIYEGSIPLDSVNPPSTGDIVLQAGPGAALTAREDNYISDGPAAEAVVDSAALEIVDASGLPVVTVLEDGTARVRLYSGPSNAGPGVDTVQVQLTSLYANDQEAVTLTETGGSTGVFEGSVPLRYTFATPGNGTLETLTSGAPEHLGDLVTAAFGAVRASVRTVGARVVFLDGYGREISTLALGAPVRVRVTDYRRNGPSIRDSYPLDLVGCGDTEVLTLQETGFNTGVYEGTIPSAASSGVSGNGTFDGAIGCAVEARWNDAGRPAPLSAQASFGGSSIAFTDAQGNLTGVFLNGSRAYVRVESAGNNYNPGSQDTLNGVIVRSDVTGDQLAVELYETGANTGVFTGSFELRTALYPSPYNNVLEIGEEQGPPHLFDTITAQLGYGPEEITATATTRNYRIWLLDAFGRVTDSYAQGTRVYVRVEDHRYSSPNSTVTISARLTASSGDTVYVQIQETAPNSRIFEGSVALDSVNPPATDDVLQAGPGATVTAVEGDGSFEADPATAVIEAAALEFIDAAGLPAAEVLEGTAAQVRLYSAQDNVNPSAVDTAQVQVSSLYGADTEVFTLTETGAGTGVFEGPAALSLGASVPGNGSLETSTSGAPEYLGDLLTASYGAYNATARTVAARVEFLGVRGEVVTSYPQRSTVRLRIEDHNRDQTSGIDSFPAEIHALGTGDRETVTMTETGGTTGVFLGSVPNYDVPTIQFNGTLSVYAGHVAEVWHVSPFRTDPIIAQATFRDSYAPRAVDDTAQAVEGSTASIPVLDNDISFSSPLTVGSVTQGANGSVTISPDQREVYYFSDSGFVGTDTFTYTARTGEGEEESATVTVTVIRANQSPVANPDTMYVDEDGSATFDVLLNDTDPDNDPVAVVEINTSGRHGSVFASSLNYNGITYTATTPNFHGTDSFIYKIADDQGYTAFGTVTVIVRPVNDAPVAVNDTASVNEDGSVAINVLANDTDVDNDTLTVSSVTVETHGDATVQPDGTVTFVPSPDFSGVASFDYVLSDGNGGTDVGSVTITVNGVNDGPSANADTTTVEEDGSVDVAVLSNDTDPENDTLSVTAVTQGTNGAVAINPDKTVKYTPAANFSGTDSFTYTISDGNGGTATATVTVTVTAANDAPSANADTATVAEDGTVDVAVLSNDTDPDNDTLSVTAVTQGTNGAVVINPDKTVKYTPAANFSGTDSFTYTISDGNGGTATATVTVTVTSANDAPVAVNDAATVAEDGTVAVAVLDNDADPDGDSLTVASVTQGANGAVAINANGTVSYTPAANFKGTDSFTYTIADGNGGGSTATVNVTVTPVNDAPVANNDAASVSEDGFTDIDVIANDTDADNDTLTVTSVTQGNGGAVSINANGTVRYAPSANFNGTDSFTYTISDGNGGNALATVNITVNADNDAPVANDDSAAVAEDGSVSISVLANDSDPENDALTVSAVTQGTSGAVTINANGTVTYAPAANFHGSDSFTYTVSDGNGGTDTATVNVSVSSVNDAPVANDDIATVAEDGSTSFSVLGNDTDADGDNLSVASVTQGASGAVSINANGTLMYTPSANFHGTDSFTYTVSDGNGGTDTAAVSVTISAVNDPPAATADTAVVAEDGAVNVAVLANDSDPESDVLTVTSVTQGSFGAVSINPDKTVRYVPSPSYNGADSFTYTISDGNGGTAIASVSVTVTAVNDAPVAVNDSASVTAGAAVTVSVLANDSDIDSPSLTITGVTQGAKGSVAINANGTVTYTAGLFSGNDSFTYTISDGAGGTATGTVTVTLLAPARVTSGIQARYDFNEGSGSTVNDTSGVGTPLNLTIGNTASVTWLPGALSVNTATAITNNNAASKILTAVRASNAVTVEAWITPDNLGLTGPARILQLWKNGSQRNIVFGQSGSRYETLLRTSTGTPSLLSPAASVTLDLVHVVYTRNSLGQTVYYINGTQVASGTAGGNLSAWGTDHKLSLADNWTGDYHLVAVYSRALAATEVQQNFLAGQNAN